MLLFLRFFFFSQSTFSLFFSPEIRKFIPLQICTKETYINQIILGKFNSYIFIYFVKKKILEKCYICFLKLTILRYKNIT